MKLQIAGLTDAHLAAVRQTYGDVITRPLWKRALPWVISALIVAYLGWLWIKFGLGPEVVLKGVSKLGGFIVGKCVPGPGPFSGEFFVGVIGGLRAMEGLGGLGVLPGLLAQLMTDTCWVSGGMIPPDPGPYAGEFLKATGETVGMAFLGTLFSSLIAFPLAYAGASNVVRNPVIHFTVRRIFDIFRGIPSIIWALVFVAAFGLGPMAGVLALMMSDFAALAKLGAEAIENADKKPVEGVTSTGASWLEVLRYAYVPQILPVQLSQALYFFESNVRSAAVLGIVGAGGIGYYLSDLSRNNHWDMVAFILVVFLILVAIIDMISKRLRGLITGERK